MNRRTPSIVTTAMLALLCLLFCASTAAAQSKKVQLVVTVKDSQGHAVPNARVNVWHSLTQRLGNPGGVAVYNENIPDYYVDTTPEGVATLNINATSNRLTLVIRVVKTDFEPGQEVVNYSSDPPPEITRTIFIRRNSIQAGDMRLTVHVETATGEKVSAADVVVAANTWPTRRTFSGQTDASGNARIFVMKFDSFEVQVTKAGYPEKHQHLQLDGRSLPDIAPLFTVKLDKPAGIIMRVHVADADSPEQGVSTARISLDGVNVPANVSDTTDDSGNATLLVPQPGTYRLKISQSTYNPFTTRDIEVPASDQPQDLSFTLEPFVKDGPNSIDVAVLVPDKTNRNSIVGKFQPLANAVVAIQYAGGRQQVPTNSSGRATFGGSFEGDVNVTVEAAGYKAQAKVVNVRETIRAKGTHESITFTMQEANTQDALEVVVLTNDNKDGDNAQVPVEGASVTAGGATATTDGSGRALLQGYLGDETVKVSKAGFKSQTRQVQYASPDGSGKPTASATFILQPVATEDSIDVTVVSTNLSGGTTPVEGATVTAGNASATTDGSGHAQLKGKIGETAQVTATAVGFGRKTASVMLKQPERSTSVTIALQADLRLIVEVHDRARPDRKIAGASVSFRLRDSDATLGGTHYTNDQGEAFINLADTPGLSLDRIRSGLTLVAGKNNPSEKYETKESAVSSELLEPSAEPRRLTIFLDRDWTELHGAVDALEQRVMAWRNDASQTSGNVVASFIDQALAARKDAEENLKSIEAAREAFGQTLIPGGLQNQRGEIVKQEILVAQAEANQKAETLKKMLDDASALASKCSPTDAETIRIKYRSAIQLLAEIGTRNKRAVAGRDELVKSASESMALKNILEELKGKGAKISADYDAAAQAEINAETALGQLHRLKQSLTTRRVGLIGELSVLKVKYEVDTAELPPDLKGRINTIDQLLTGWKEGVSSGTPADDVQLTSITTAIQTIDRIRNSAAKVLGQYQNSTRDIDTMDQTVDGINTTLSNASFEIGLAADLPKQADRCATSASTNPADGGNRRPVVEDIPDPLDPAKPKSTNQPANNGSNKPVVEDLPDPLDSGKPTKNRNSSGGSNTRSKPVVEDIPDPLDSDKRRSESSNGNGNTGSSNSDSSNRGGSSQGSVDAGPWSGSYVNENGTGTISISGGANGLTASEEWHVNDRSGKGTWSNCKVQGNTVECVYTGSYEGDPAKSGTRHGKITAALDGNVLYYTMTEGKPDFKNADGTPFDSSYSAMQEGAVWKGTYKRK